MVGVAVLVKNSKYAVFYVSFSCCFCISYLSYLRCFPGHCIAVVPLSGYLIRQSRFGFGECIRDVHV